MATASVTHAFVNSTAADATEVNTNFSELVSFLNNNVVHVDASKAMTGNFDAGSNRIINVATPTSGTDSANKTYVDTATGALNGWQSYTPTWTNITVGNATQFFRYRTVPGGTRVVGVLTWGSTSAVGSAVVSFTLPTGVEVSSDLSGMSLGTASYDDAGSQGPDRGGVAWAVGTSSVRINWGNSGNWNTSSGGPDGNTMATGDKIGVNLFVPDIA